MIRGLKFTTKNGPGRGWWGPPKGDHGSGRSGEVGGSSLGSQSDFNRRMGLYIEDLAIPPGHSKGLSFSTLSPGKFYKEAEDGTWYFDDPLGLDNVPKVLGVYNKDTQVIHLSPVVIDETSGLPLKHIVTHEIGHHVHNTVLSIPQSKGRLLSQKTVPELEKYANLHDFGLRKYSIVSEQELMADSYRVWLHGSESQFSNLQNIISKTTGLDLIELFGER